MSDALQDAVSDAEKEADSDSEGLTDALRDTVRLAERDWVLERETVTVLETHVAGSWLPT